MTAESCSTRYVEMLIEKEVQRVDAELRAMRESVDKAERVLGLRLEGMNEIREQLADQALTFVRHDVIGPRVERVEERVAVLEQWRAVSLGVSGERSAREESIRPWMLIVAVGLIALTNGLILFAANVLVK